ncbi:MAG: SpoIIE family protein phosphatase [Brevinematales bacterium]|nr:SpoIIE family protein phosphatase [Brevinematales bacterium]
MKSSPENLGEILFPALFNPLPLGIVIVDEKYSLLYANPYVYTILGLEVGAPLPSLFSLFPSLPHLDVSCHTPPSFLRTDLITPVKSHVPIILTTYPLSLPHQNMKGYILAFLDQMSTFQIQTLFEEVSHLSTTLQEERATFEHLLNRLQSGILWGNTTRIWYANTRAKDLLGPLFSPEIGIVDLFADNEKLMHYLNRKVTLSNLEMELSLVTRPLPCLVNISYLPMKDEPGWIIEILDIEEKKKIENSIMDMAQIFIRERNELRESQRMISRELHLAREIQFSLLPHKEYPSLAYLYQPMEEIGGDFLDIFELDDSHIGIFISDVCGHGIAASLLTVMLKQKLGELKSFAFHPDHFLTALNRTLFHQLRGYFLTALYAVYNTKEGLLSLANAGHPYPFLYTQRHFATLATKRSQPIGIHPSTQYETSTRVVRPGDRILFYTDGLLETENHQGESFEEKRLGEFLEHNASKAPYALLQGLLDDLRTFHGERNLPDDIALICLDIS